MHDRLATLAAHLLRSLETWHTRHTRRYNAHHGRAAVTTRRPPL